MSATDTMVASETTSALFDKTHRCDNKETVVTREIAGQNVLNGCGTEAYARVEYAGGAQLHFCTRHWRDHSTALEAGRGAITLNTAIRAL
jgi:hypothetical protein